jgi:uncharacterized membrane protein YdjX (TVP38/TMEM64 family)
MKRCTLLWLLLPLVLTPLALGVWAWTNDISLPAACRDAWQTRDIAPLAALADALGRGGAVAFVLAYEWAVPTFLPLTFFTIAGVLLFGFWKGLLLSLAGMVIGVSHAFALGRHGAAKLLPRRLVESGTYRAFDEEIRRDSAGMLLALRLFPLNPFSLLNYLCGMSSMRFVPFLAATMLGELPMTTATAYLGSTAGQLLAGQKPDWRFLAVLTAAALATGAVAAVHRLQKRSAAGGKPE